MKETRSIRRVLCGGVMSNANIIFLIKNFKKSDHVGELNVCG
jgi:hypothetical protein